MDPRPLLHQSPPSQQETLSSSGFAPSQYEPPPSQLASSSPRSAPPPNVSLPPPSPPPSSPPLLHQSPPSLQETSSSSRSAPSQYEPPPSQLASPFPRSASAPNVSLPPPSPPSSLPRASPSQTGGATATGDHTISNEPPAQDLMLSVPRSTAPTLPPGAVAGARPLTFWRFILPMRSPTLPVTNPQPVRQSIFSQFNQWHESRQGHLLPDGVVQVRIAVCGFAIYGIMALLGNTWDLVKEFPENGKVLVLFLIGFIWTVATVAVPLTMCGRTRLFQALSHHFTHLVLLGITLHMLFNVSLMLPRNFWLTTKMNLWSLVAFVFLLILAIIGHGVVWIESSVYGEVEEKPTQQNGNNMESS